MRIKLRYCLLGFINSALYYLTLLYQHSSCLQIRKVDANTVTIDISFCVLFLKSTMMKYIIERSTNGEMAKWLEVFYKHLKKVGV